MFASALQLSTIRAPRSRYFGESPDILALRLIRFPDKTGPSVSESLRINRVTNAATGRLFLSILEAEDSAGRLRRPTTGL